MTNNEKIGLGVGAALVLYFATRGNTTYVDPGSVPPLSTEQQPTITRKEALQIADAVGAAIYADSMFWGWGFGALGENEERVVAALTQPTIRTTGDVLLVAEEYGVRGEWFTPDYTMFQAIGAYLEPRQIDRIATAWKQRGIKLEPR